MPDSEGAQPFHYLSAASTNATSVLARRSRLEQIIAINTTATLYYLKFFDKASAPSLGTDVPVFTVPVPASATGAGVVISFPSGVRFRLGLAFALTGGVADNDSANAATGVAIDLFAR